MIERKASWIRGKHHTIRLASGGVDGYRWQLYVSVRTSDGEITTKPDKSAVRWEDKVKVQYRAKDRKFFIRQLGEEYMSDKEVDHQWGSNPIWTRVVSATENGGRHRVESERKISFVETEDWIEEKYKGKRR